MYTKVGKKLHKTSARKKKRGQCTKPQVLTKPGVCHNSTGAHPALIFLKNQFRVP